MSVKPGKYRDMQWDDLLVSAGVHGQPLDAVLKVIAALEALGADQNFRSALRQVLAGHASLREMLGVQVGDRVRIRPELVNAEAARWKNSDHATTCRTFSEDGEVTEVHYNEWHDRWYALVRFDAEYWQHYQTREYQHTDRRHVWAITLDALESIGAGTYGGRHERVIEAGSAQA